MKTWKTMGVLVALASVLLPQARQRVVEAGQKMQATLASINAINVIVKSELLFADKTRAKTNGGLDIKVV